MHSEANPHLGLSEWKKIQIIHSDILSFPSGFFFFFFYIYNWNDPLISKFYFKSDIGEVSWAPHQFWNGRMFYKQSWIGWFIIITLFVGISTHSKGKILNWQTPHKKQTRTTVTCSVLKTMCAPYDLLPQRRKFW